ncbi:MAG: hypothetical protein R3F61_14010 [Myxococcota bacterium]
MWLLVSAALACSCGRVPIRVLAPSAELVFQGRVVGEPRDRRYTVEVRHVWKGDVPETVEVESGVMCGPSFVVGDEVAFALPSLDPPPLGCSGHDRMSAEATPLGLGPPARSRTLAPSALEIAIEACDREAIERAAAGARPWAVQGRTPPLHCPAEVLALWIPDGSSAVLPNGLVEHGDAATVARLAERSPAIRNDVIWRAGKAGRQDVLDALVPNPPTTLEACFDTMNPLPRDVRHAAAIALMDAGAVLRVDGYTEWTPARATRDGFPDDRVLAMLRSLPEDVRRSSSVAVLDPAASKGRLALFDQVWSEVGAETQPGRAVLDACGAGVAAVEHVQRTTRSTEDPWTCACMQRAARFGHFEVFDRRDSLDACANDLWPFAWMGPSTDLFTLLDARAPRPAGPDAARLAIEARSIDKLRLALDRGARPGEALRWLVSEARSGPGGARMDDEELQAYLRVLLDAGASPPDPSSSLLDRLADTHPGAAELLLEAASAEAE